MNEAFEVGERLLGMYEKSEGLVVLAVGIVVGGYEWEDKLEKSRGCR